LPGIFIQDEITFTKNKSYYWECVMITTRFTEASITPRIAYKWKLNDNNIIRLNAGTGFRVVNLFTE
jgi:outer membrane receptor for ferrienterochelin and colicins